MSGEKRIGIKFNVDSSQLKEMNSAIATLERFNQQASKMSQAVNQISNNSSNSGQKIKNLAQEIDKIDKATNAASNAIKNGINSISQMEKATQKLTNEIKNYGRDVKVVVDSNGKLNASFKDAQGNITKMSGEYDKANNRFVNFKNSVTATANSMSEMNKATQKSAQEMKAWEQEANRMTQAYNKLHQGTDISSVITRNNGKFDVYNDKLRQNGEIVRANIDRNGKFTQTLRDQSGVITTVNGYYNQAHGRLIEYSSSVSSGNKKVSESMKSVSDAAKSGAYDINDWAKSFEIAFNRMIQWTAVTTVFFQMINVFKQVGTTIMQVDEQMTNLKRVMNPEQFGAVTDAAEGFNNMLKTATDTAQSLGVTVVGVLQSMNEFARQGFDANSINYLSKMTTVFSAVADIDMGTAASYLTSVMKIFNLQAEESVRIVDQLNQVDNDYAVSSDDLAQSLARAGGTAKAFGVTLEQNLGHTVAIGEATRESGAIIGNSLKTIYSRITTVDGAISSLKNVGVNVFDPITKDTRQVNDILGDLAGKWDGLSKAQKENLGVQIAGRNQLSRFLVLMDRWDQAIAATDTAYNASGSAMREYQKYLESIKANVNLSIGAFQKLAITLGENGVGAAIVGVLKLVTKFTDGLTFMVDKLGAVTYALPLVAGALILFSNNLNTAKTNMVAFQLATAQMSGVSTEAKLAMMAAAQQTASFGTVAINTAKGIGSAFLAVITNPFVWIPAAVIGLVSLTGHLSQARQETARMGDSARDAAFEFGQLQERVAKGDAGEYDVHTLEKRIDKLDELTNAVSFHKSEIDRANETYSRAGKDINLFNADITELKDVIMSKSNGTDYWFESLPKDLKESAAAMGVTYEKGMSMNEFLKKLEEQSNQSKDAYGKLTKSMADKQSVVDATKAYQDLNQELDDTFEAFSKITGLKDQQVQAMKEQLGFIEVMTRIPKEARSGLQQSGLEQAVAQLGTQYGLTADQTNKLMQGNEGVINSVKQGIGTYEGLANSLKKIGEAENENDRQKAISDATNEVYKVNELDRLRQQNEGQWKAADVYKQAEQVKRDELIKSTENMKSLGLISGEVADSIIQKMGGVSKPFQDLSPTLENAKNQFGDFSSSSSQSLSYVNQKLQEHVQASGNANSQTATNTVNMAGSYSNFSQGSGLAIDFVGERLGGLQQTGGNVADSMQSSNQLMSNSASTSATSQGQSFDFVQASLNVTQGAYGQTASQAETSGNNMGQSAQNSATTTGQALSNVNDALDKTGQQYGTTAGDAGQATGSMRDNATSDLGTAKGEANGLTRALEGLSKAWDALKNAGSIALNFLTGGLAGGGGTDSVRDLTSKINGQANMIKNGGGTVGGMFSGLPVTSQFGGRIDPFTGKPSGHNGMDFGAPTGTAVRATTGGVVIKSGWGAPGSGYGGYGNVVAIQDMSGFVHIYGHNSGVSVREGQFVPAGSTIASSGSTGRSTAPHIHYEVRSGGSAIDPSRWVGGRGGGTDSVRDLRKPKYHSGGVVQGGIVDDNFRRNNEVDARLLKGEMVLTQQQQKSLFMALDSGLEEKRRPKFHSGGVVGGFDKLFGKYPDKIGSNNSYVINNIYQGEYKDRTSALDYLKELGVISVSTVLAELSASRLRGKATTTEDKNDYNKRVVDNLKQLDYVDSAMWRFDAANLYLPDGIKSILRGEIINTVRENGFKALKEDVDKFMSDFKEKMPEVNEMTQKYLDLNKEIVDQRKKMNEQMKLDDFVNNGLMRLGIKEQPKELDAIEEKMKSIEERSKTLLEQNGKIKMNYDMMALKTQAGLYQRQFKEINDKLWDFKQNGAERGLTPDQIKEATKEMTDQWNDIYKKWDEINKVISENQSIVESNDKVLGDLSEEYKKLQKEIEETKRKTEIMDKIKDKVQSIFNWNSNSLMKDKTDEFGNTVRDIEGNIRAVLDVQKAIEQVTSDIYANIDKTVQEMISDILTSQLPDIGSLFNKETDYSGIATGISGAIDKIKPAWNDTLDYMAVSMSNMFNSDQWTNLINNWTMNMGEAMKNLAPILGGVFASLPETFAKIMSDLPSLVNTAIQNITVGLFNTVINILNNIVGLVNQIIPAGKRIPMFEEMQYAKPTYTQNNETTNNNDTKVHQADTNVNKSTTFIVQTGVAIGSESELKEFAMIIKKMIDEETERDK